MELCLYSIQKRSNKHERLIISILVLLVNKMVLQMANALFLQMSGQKRQEVEERITLNCPVNSAGLLSRKLILMKKEIVLGPTSTHLLQESFPGYLNDGIKKK